MASTKILIIDDEEDVMDLRTLPPRKKPAFGQKPNAGAY
jgi:hypothetical protein